MSDVLLSLEQITKRYGPEYALKEINFSALAGETTLLLGANGSGKSTMLRLAAGLVRATHGAVKVLKETTLSHSGHKLFLYLKLSVLENLKLFTALSRTKLDLAGYLTAWNLDQIKDKNVTRISKGEAQRISLARAFIGQPKVLLLDEPSAALDESPLQLLKEKIRAHTLAGGAAVIATHDLSRMQELADRAVVLEGGALIADSTTSGRSSQGSKVQRLAETLDLYRRRNR